MGKKYTQSMIVEKLKPFGYTLLNEFSSVNKKVEIVSNDGYKYFTALRDLLYSGKVPIAFHKSNPHTIENIQNYININEINCKILSVEYTNNSSNMKWECSCGETFEATWNKFSQGKTTCNKCGIQKTIDARLIKRDINDISKEFKDRGYELITSEYKNTKQKLEYICYKHKEKGSSKVTYTEFKNGTGCIHCARELIGKNKRINEEELIQLTESKGFIYCGNKYINGSCHILFKCKNHINKGVQEKPLQYMRKSDGKCNYCNGRKRDNKDCLKIIKEINPNIKILSTYINATKSIKCKCLIDGYEWISNANNLMCGRGCKQCGLKLLSEAKTKTHDDFILEIKNSKPNIEITSQYTGCKDIIECKCKIDGTTWSTTPTSLLSASIGCPTCISKSTGERCRKGNEQFLDELKLINPDILPLEKYINEITKIKCKCLKHNYIWYASPNKILRRKTGCPKCASYHNENNLDNILDNWGFNYQIQKRYKDCIDKKTLPFDKYLIDYGILIEYDGEGHYMPIRRGSMSENDAIKQFELVKKHDQIKTEYCKKNNIPLIRIPYWERKDMEYYLFDRLVKLGFIEEIEST